MFAKLPRVTCTVFLARFLPRRLEARSKTTHFHTRTSAHKPLSTTMDYPCTRIHVAKLRLFHQHLVYTWQATSFHGDWQSFDALCLSLLLCYWGLLMCFRLLSSEVVVALMVLSVFDSMNLNCVKITDTWTVCADVYAHIAVEGWTQDALKCQKTDVHKLLHVCSPVSPIVPVRKTHVSCEFDILCKKQRCQNQIFSSWKHIEDVNVAKTQCHARQLPLKCHWLFLRSTNANQKCQCG